MARWLGRLLFQLASKRLKQELQELDAEVQCIALWMTTQVPQSRGDAAFRRQNSQRKFRSDGRRFKKSLFAQCNQSGQTLRLHSEDVQQCATQPACKDTSFDTVCDQENCSQQQLLILLP